MATATKAAARPIVTAEFTHEKETKGAVQYKQDLEPGVLRGEIGSIYLTKASLAKVTGTKRIRVTVEAIG